MSEQWLAEHKVDETKQGWDGGTRWRSPAEIQELRCKALQQALWDRAVARRRA